MALLGCFPPGMGIEIVFGRALHSKLEFGKEQAKNLHGAAGMKIAGHQNNMPGAQLMKDGPHFARFVDGRLSTHPDWKEEAAREAVLDGEVHRHIADILSLVAPTAQDHARSPTCGSQVSA